MKQETEMLEAWKKVREIADKNIRMLYEEKNENKKEIDYNKFPCPY